MNPLSTPPLAGAGPAGNRAIVTVIGGDRVGIIAAVATLLAEADVNILDISQSIMQEFFVMIMMVDLAKASAGFDRIQAGLNARGVEMTTSDRTGQI